VNGWCDGTLANAMCPVTGGADPGSGGFDGLAAAMASAFAQLLQALLGFWSRPDGAGDLAAPGGLVAALGAYTTTLVAATATLGVIVAGTRLAIGSSRADQPARDLARGLMVLALVAGAGAATVQAVRSVLDDAADGLLTRGLDGAPVASQLAALVDLQRGGITPGVTFLLGLLGSLSTFVQFFVMVARGPVLALLVGLLPIAAASAMTGTGMAYVRRLVAWIGALTAYKFVAGLLYAGAFLAVRGTDGGSVSAASAAAGSDRITGVVTGIALVIVAVGALPALVRLLTPAVAAATGLGGGLAEIGGPPVTGTVPLSGRGRQGTAAGPPSDAGPRSGAGLLRGPSGTSPWGAGGTGLRGTGRGSPEGPAGRARDGSGGQDARDGSGGQDARDGRGGRPPGRGPAAPPGGRGAGTGWPAPASAAGGAVPREGAR